MKKLFLALMMIISSQAFCGFSEVNAIIPLNSVKKNPTRLYPLLKYPHLGSLILVDQSGNEISLKHAGVNFYGKNNLTMIDNVLYARIDNTYYGVTAFNAQDIQSVYEVIKFEDGKGRLAAKSDINPWILKSNSKLRINIVEVGLEDEVEVIQKLELISLEGRTICYNRNYLSDNGPFSLGRCSL